jgi:poly(A) polymerase Pap1
MGCQAYYNNVKSIDRCGKKEVDIDMPSQQLLNLIKEAMKDERHDYKKYRLMMNMTSSAQIKDQIRFAYADEGVITSCSDSCIID